MKFSLVPKVHSRLSRENLRNGDLIGKTFEFFRTSSYFIENFFLISFIKHFICLLIASKATNNSFVSFTLQQSTPATAF